MSLQDRHFLFSATAKEQPAKLRTYLGDAQPAVLAALIKLRDDGPANPAAGICNNLGVIVKAEYGIWHPHAKNSYNRSWWDKACDTVYHYTGQCAPILGYEGTIDKWGGDQLAARRILIDRLIQALE